MKAIIVDDEPKAIKLLEGYLAHFQGIELLATFRNGLKAFEFMTKESVDLLFLDINMPHLSGLTLSKMVSKDIRIIFTTAYAEYAVESYEVHTVDYLLKPISLERFNQAIGKVFKDLPDRHSINKSINKEDIILLKSGNRTYRISTSDILFLEKEGNYMTYHFPNQKILTRASIGEALKQLPSHFTQCHKSYIVNCSKINFFNKEEISLSNHQIPIGNAFKTKFLQAMKE